MSLRSWEGLEKQTGATLRQLSAPHEGTRHTLDSITAQPGRALNSPTWTGIEEEGTTYSPFTQNLRFLLPFHTLSGRQHFYLDHQWMRAMGESLPVFRNPLPLALIGETTGRRIPRVEGDLVLNMLTPHSK